MRIRLLVSVIGLAALAGSAANAALPIRKDMPYRQARAKLIAVGAKPVKVVRTEENSFACQSHAGWCKRWPELEDCTGAGVALCNMLFRMRDGKILTVTVTGEGPTIVTGFRVERR